MSGTLNVIGKRMTFGELLREYPRVELDGETESTGIEIPMIQRDYAQGRANATVGEVRGRFLEALQRTLEKEPDDPALPLNLDFIFGSVAERGGAFIPLDGQQRLTTLFLLHWYLAWRDDRHAEFQELARREGRFCRFSYRTRPSSGEFFDLLSRETPEMKAADLPTGENRLRLAIEDCQWFRSLWKHDPTVESALTVLQDMHDRFRDSTGSYTRLSAAEPRRYITFDVLDIRQFKAGDDLYLKMNARGKPLTPFEHFKAWLEQNEDVSPAAKQALDRRWLDGVWRMKPRGEKQVDGAYLRTVYALALNHRFERGTSEPKYGQEVLQKAHAGANLLMVDWKQLFTREAREAVFEGLQQLFPTDKPGRTGLHPLRRLGHRMFFTSKTQPTWDVWMSFQGLMVCLRHSQGAPQREIRRWFRVVRNLIENSGIDAGSYANAVRSLALLGREAGGDVMTFLAGFSGKLDGFAPVQVGEEVRKAGLIVDRVHGAAWELAIRRAERHGLLRGQIGFMLDDLGPADLEQFQQRAQVVKAVLGANKSLLGSAEFLVIRGALSLSGVCPALGWQQSLSLADDAPTWRAVLRGTDAYGPIRHGMTRLLDELSGCHSAETMEARLRSLCEGYHDEGDWRHDVVKFGGALLPASQTKKVQNYYNTGVFLFHKTNWNDLDILLGPGARGRNAVVNLLASSGDWRLPGWVTRREVRNQCYYAGHGLVLEHATRAGIRLRFDNLICHLETAVGGGRWEAEGSPVDASAEDGTRIIGEIRERMGAVG